MPLCRRINALQACSHSEKRRYRSGSGEDGAWMHCAPASAPTLCGMTLRQVHHLLLLRDKPVFSVNKTLVQQHYTRRESLERAFCHPWLHAQLN